MSLREEVAKDTKQRLDRTHPPKPGPIPVVSFPKFHNTQLSNGLPVILVENHEQPLVTLSVYLRAGSMYDPRELEGLTAVLSDMLPKGTASRTALQIAEEIDFVGGSLHAGASWDSMTVSIAVLTKFLDSTLELLSDIILLPTFPQEELDRVKVQRLAALKHAKADAGYLADSLFSKLLYPTHPYGQQASGTEGSIGQITTEDLKSFYADIFGSNLAFIVAAGDVTSPNLMTQLENLFGGWKSARGPSDVSSAITLASQRSVGLIEKQGAVQSAIRVGHPGIERKNDDYLHTYVLNMLLGGYFNSRINQNLREKHGFTYGARSYFDARFYEGPFVVSTEVQTDVTVRAIEEILFELGRIIAEPISEDELSMVKDYVIGSFPLQIETPQQVASRTAMIELYGLESDYYDTFRMRVASITRDELLAVARKYLHPDRVTIVVSGNLETLREPMKVFGGTETYNADLKQL